MIRAWLLLLALLAPALARAVDAEIRAGSITMSPASPASDSDVTICFDVRNTGNQEVRFAVGFAPDGYVWNQNTVNQINWVLWDNNVYRGGSITVSGTAGTALTNQTSTSIVGSNNGYSIGSGRTTWTQVCFQTHIPPEFSGDYQVVIAPNRDGIGLQTTSCGTVQSASNAASYGNADFTVTGTPLIRLNLEVCNAGSTASEMRWQWRVTNYGEAGVRLTNLSLRYCFYDTNMSLEAQSSSNARAYLFGGTGYCNTYNPDSQYSFENFPTVDCGADGMANQCYVYTLSGGPVSQSMPYYVPPDGGYMQSESPAIWFRFTGSPPWDTSDDYANLTNAPTCGFGWSSLPRLALYNSGSLVCEWESSSNTDGSTGIPHCGSTGGCNDCEDGSVSNVARNAQGASNVVCLPIVSPTPTPNMQLTKVATPGTAMLGQTITYNITWTNNSSAATTMIIWDTIPANLSFLACTNACSNSGGILTWNLGSQAAGASGTVQFRAVVTGLPFLPDWMERRQALGPSAPRSRELAQGLWAPLHR